jgi:polyphosphate glucokinase
MVSVSEQQQTGPTTLAIDIGGTGLKASVLDVDGRKIVNRVRTETPYPCPPRVLIRELDRLTHRLPRWDRISVGFPGFVRAGRVLTAPNLSTKAGPGTALSRKLVDAWAGFPLAAELEGRLGKPTRLSNDADMHGLAVISGEGLELVLTLGTGLGTAVFIDGTPTPHLELALMPFRGRGTFQDQLGNRTRRRIGNRRWNSTTSDADPASGSRAASRRFLRDHDSAAPS